MSAFPPAFRAAQVVGLTGAAWLSGNIFVYSIGFTPSILQALHENNIPPATAAKLWQNAYARGKAQNPPLAAATAAAFLYLAWSVREGTALSLLAPQGSTVLYSAAAVLTVGIVPYTLAFMMGTNHELEAKAESKVGAELPAREVEPLLNRWEALNVIRGVFPLVAGVLGLVAALP
ncbi:DUF1772 domain-containing protein [Aspergillus clavatus NRRL 1]|uniref:DUF1772 domain protein n=1 Tax=Aspergillus clavatus (strain ATCC 1007 / CBS 513.65 / DSM 816 / NCTC 3887 / NRRL 1 / QM 1276 / 107) TaxID=344612 RepID=A1CHN7_ASPCL|nr:uncharacterized protein ACLA_048640 [Aspergillus clavatus NRRL 1]EAW10392.1 conserved hypothetical protein [Aspergillus clavatus NRRL 1]